MNLTSRGDNLWIMAAITVLRAWNGCGVGGNSIRSSSCCCCSFVLMVRFCNFPIKLSNVLLN